MKEYNEVKIQDIELAVAVIANEAVHSFCGTEQLTVTQPQQLVSCTGGVFFGLRDEKWPSTKSGEPLIPWLQVVCSDMTNAYGAFYNKQSICFYISEEFDGWEAISAEDAADFVVREYSVNDELVPLERPEQLQGHPFHQVKWQSMMDYPSIRKYRNLFAKEVYDSICEDESFKLENQSGIKIGGWPTPMQGDQDYPRSYDIQIDMTENYMYGDSGIGYLNRTANGWYLIFESC